MIALEYFQLSYISYAWSESIYNKIFIEQHIQVVVWYQSPQGRCLFCQDLLDYQGSVCFDDFL